MLPKNNAKPFSCKIEYNNDETLKIKKEIIGIEYSVDESLEIKEEMIEGKVHVFLVIIFEKCPTPNLKRIIFLNFQTRKIYRMWT